MEHDASQGRKAMGDSVIGYIDKCIPHGLWLNQLWRQSLSKGVVYSLLNLLLVV